jgi:hypothetical protein
MQQNQYQSTVLVTWLVLHIQVPSILATSSLNFMSLVRGPWMLIFSEMVNIWVLL